MLSTYDADRRDEAMRSGSGVELRGTARESLTSVFFPRMFWTLVVELQDSAQHRLLS